MEMAWEEEAFLAWLPLLTIAGAWGRALAGEDATCAALMAHICGNADELAASEHQVVKHGDGRLWRGDPVGPWNAGFRHFHAVMDVGVKLAILGSTKPQWPNILQPQGEAAVRTFLHNRKLQHFPMPDQGAQAKHLQICKAQSAVIVGLGAPLAPEPFHLILDGSGCLGIDAKKLGRDHGLRR